MAAKTSTWLFQPYLGDPYEGPRRGPVGGDLLAFSGPFTALRTRSWSVGPIERS